MADRLWLFSYGTLRQPGVQMELFGRLLEEREDALPGFKVEMIRIADDAVITLSRVAEHPILRRGLEEDRVEGVALAVSADDVTKADAYETADYRRIEVRLESGRRAFVYVHRDDQ